MRYVALGDSISIDYYTEVEGGGAASQFAAKIGASGENFQNLTRDGNVTTAVLLDLERIRISPQIVTLTAGGNDFLMDRPVPEIQETLDQICRRLARLECPVILNTVYDPTDGDDQLALQIGLRPEQRETYRQLNQGIRILAEQYGFILSDLETLFHHSGLAASPSWIVRVIEPNLLGATAIASHWLGLWRGHSASSQMPK